MVTLTWTDKSLGERSVDINKLDFVQTDDFAPYWSICCGAALYDVDISQRLFVHGDGECRKKIFTYDFETGEFEDTKLSISDVNFFEYDKNDNAVVIVLKDGSEFAVDPALYSIDFKENSAEQL